MPTNVTDMPWNHIVLRPWSIVGMNHYHRDGRRYLFVAMTKDKRCIKAEGWDEAVVFERLIAQAQVPEALASWELVTMLQHQARFEPHVFVEMKKDVDGHTLHIQADAATVDQVFQMLIMKANARPELPIREGT